MLSRPFKIFDFFEKVVNFIMRGSLENWFTIKKRENISYSCILFYFDSKEPFKKDDVEQQKFWRILHF
jgi:hypothetical protein